MNFKKAKLLTVLAAVSILQFSNMNQVHINAETSDYVDGVFQAHKYQDEATNLFLGNSIFSIDEKTMALHNSICLNSTNSGSIMMVIELNTDIFDLKINKLTVKGKISDPSDPNNYVIIDKNHSDLYDFSFDQMDEGSFYCDGKRVYLEFYVNNFDNQFILHGIDKDNYFQIHIDCGVDLYPTSFLLIDESEADYFHEYYEDVYTPPEMGEYKNSIIKYNNEQYSFVSNVTNPISIEQILSGFKAFDFSDNEEVEITYRDIDYLEARENKTLGKYYINLIATDSNNNTSYLQVEINLKDLYGPVINIADGSSIIRIPISTCGEVGSSINLNDYVLITDDYDDDVSLTSESSTITYQSIGSSHVTLEAKDSSGNLTSQNFTVEFYDDIKPTISIESTSITIYPFEYKSAQDIVNNLVTITDNVGVATSGIKEDNYTENYKKEGEYSFIIYAEDEEGNYIEQEVIVNVVDSQGPVFFINETYLEIDANSEYLSAQSMLNMLIETNQVKYKKYKVVEYVNETYNENYQTPGEYEVVIACYDEDYNKELISVKLTINEVKTNLNFFAKVQLFFTDLFDNIKDFFVNIYNEVCSWFTK